MMRCATSSRAAALIVGLFGLSISGCDALTSNEEHAFRVCEGYVKEGLRSPSTYSRVKAISNIPRQGSGVRTVHLEYDADNAFGTPVRGYEMCAFKVNDDGDFPGKSTLELGASVAAVERSQKELLALQGKRKTNDMDQVYACCVGPEDRERGMKAFRETGDFSLIRPIAEKK